MTDVLKTTMNAITLTILIDRYYNPEPYDHEVTSMEGDTRLSESEEDAFKFLRHMGLVEYSAEGKNKVVRAENMRKATLTPRGTVHVKALLSAPLPTPTWVSSILK